EREMEKYAEQGEEYLEEVGKSLPTIKKVLVDERNEHMANQLRKLEEKHTNVLAVIGDGHVPGISRLLADRTPREIRLNEVRDWKPRADDSASGSFTFNI
ncbi:MAG: TraB/GumN family protein, partial [Thermoplasmata archaeon]|nr:TraB/GumN family protein [Thermoplasmata archaeon]